MKSGIYIIKSKINNKSYIGSSIDIAKRFKTHLWRLNTNSHINKLLQNDYNSYGIDNFEFNVLEYCEEKDLILKENLWLSKYLDNTYCQINTISLHKVNVERFKTEIIVLENGCWTLNRRISKNGYIYYPAGIGGKTVVAHRVSYFIYKEDPVSGHVCHSCDNKYCVNPDHLFLGSASQNHKDRAKKGVGYKGSEKIANKIRKIFTDYGIETVYEFTEFLGIKHDRKFIDNILNNKTFHDPSYISIDRHKKLNKKIVAKMKREYLDGITCKELSVKYGFKYDTVHKAVNNINWKNVTPEPCKN